MDAAHNPIKQALARGDLQLGIWLALNHPGVAEMAAQAGYDWLLIDAEHGPADFGDILAQLRAISGTGAEAVVRVPMGEDWMLKRVLDMGVRTVLVPMVNSAQQARAVSAACRYGPKGTRGMGAALTRASGYGANKSYSAQADEGICLLVQVESRAALDDLEAIATTEGVDAVFIGPADLAADMGYPGNLQAEEVQEAIAKAYKVLRTLGVPSGTVVFDTSQVSHQVAQGVQFLGIGGDAVLMQNALARQLATVREALSGSTSAPAMDAAPKTEVN